MFIALNQFFYTHFIVGTSYTILKNTQFSFFRFPVQNRTYQNRAYEHHHRIQHIWISLDTKFHLNQTILPFWTKFPQKWVFWPKIKNLIITIDLSIFAVVFILNRKFEFLGHLPKIGILGLEQDKCTSKSNPANLN